MGGKAESYLGYVSPQDLGLCCTGSQVRSLGFYKHFFFFSGGNGTPGHKAEELPAVPREFLLG